METVERGDAVGHAQAVEHRELLAQATVEVVVVLLRGLRPGQFGERQDAREVHIEHSGS